MDKKKPQVNITNNFNASIVLHFEHADNVYLRMDSDGTFHFGEVESMPAQPADAPPTEAPPVSSPLDGGLLAAYAKAMASVQGFMWGQSSYAVLFCELRDHHHFPNNMSLFEQEVDALAARGHWEHRCPEKTLVDAFRNNRFLLHHVDEWGTINAPARARALLKQFQLACK